MGVLCVLCIYGVYVCVVCEYVGCVVCVFVCDVYMGLHVLCTDLEVKEKLCGEGALSFNLLWVLGLSSG